MKTGGIMVSVIQISCGKYGTNRIIISVGTVHSMPIVSFIKRYGGVYTLSIPMRIFRLRMLIARKTERNFTDTYGITDWESVIVSCIIIGTTLPESEKMRRS